MEKKIRELHQLRMEEIKAVNEKYRKIIKELTDKCEHDYGDWFTRPFSPLPDTNLFGVPFENRICKLCGYNDRRLCEK